MDERQRQVIFEKAFAALDAADEQSAIWAAQREAESFDARYEREAAEHDAFLAQCAERRRQQHPEPEPEAKQPKRTAAMDALEQRMRAFTVSMANAVARVCGEEGNKQDVKLLNHIKTLKAEIGQLKEQVAALKCDVQILTAHKMSKPTTEGSIMSLRNRRVA